MPTDKLENRYADARKRLTLAGVRFTEHNGGSHFRVYKREQGVDFWPGTGKWMDLSAGPSEDPVRGVGIEELIAYVSDVKVIYGRRWEMITNRKARMRVPGGWIFGQFSDEDNTPAVCFVPDPHHEWLLEPADRPAPETDS